ncbi:MAG: F0F1 ATP synthase subunit gamma, partial [Proteobacteria bacterium]
PYFDRYGGKVTFQKAREMAGELVQMYLNRDYDEVFFLYNEFKNAVTQKVTLEQFLPFSNPGVKETDPNSLVIIKPDAKSILEQLLGKIFAVKLFRIMLESQAGEHGARMAAMENATKNAGEMIRKLTLQYNKQRQAGITKELLEIIAGSESQKN